MSQIFSTILSGLGTFGGDVSQGLGALKGPLALASIFSQFQQQQRQKAIQDRQIYYMKHPEALANETAALTKPLDQGLIKGVGNVVQAEAGERGLNYAPGIYQQVLSQFLAPYFQQNQDRALQEVMAAAGFGGNALGGGWATPGGTGGLTQLLAALNPGGGSTWGGGMVGSTPDNALSTPSYIPQLGAGVYGPDEAPPSFMNIPGLG